MIDNKYVNEIKGINIYISEESKVSDKAKILFNSLIKLFEAQSLCLSHNSSNSAIGMGFAKKYPWA